MATFWYQLVHASGDSYTTPDKVSLPSANSDVADLRDAVKTKWGEAPPLKEVAAGSLLVYANAEALKADKDEPKPKHWLKAGKTLESVLEEAKDHSDENPLLIVVPERVQATTNGNLEELNEGIRSITQMLEQVKEQLKNEKVDEVSCSKAKTEQLAKIKETLDWEKHNITTQQLGTVTGIEVQPFPWNSDPEDNQYSETSEWLLKAINAPNEIPSLIVVSVKDEKQSRLFPSARIKLSGKADLMIAIGRTPLVYVELKKPSAGKSTANETNDNQKTLSEQARRQAEAKAYLFLENRDNDIRKLMVLTDLQDSWELLFFAEDENKGLGLYDGVVDRASALGFIRTAILLSMKQMQGNGILRRGVPWNTTYQNTVDGYGDGALAKRIKVVHEPPAEISQLARLYEEAEDDAERHLLGARMQLVMRGAMWGQTGAENVFREAEHMLRGEYLHMYA